MAPVATPVSTLIVKMFFCQSPRHHGYEAKYESLIYIVYVFACTHAVSVA